jgi:glycine oxidase
VTPSSDILVIGSGIIGCAVAYELGRRGASVRVIDDRPPGSGATRASAGMLAPYNEIDEEGAHLELTLRALDHFDPFMARLNEDSGQAVQYHRNGTLTLAFSDEARARLARLVDLMKTRQVAAALLDAGDVQREEPAASAAAVGGLFIPSHGFVAVAELTRALVAAARRFGATFEVVPRAQEIRPHQDGVTVTNGRDSFTAGTVINAAGSWSGAVSLSGAQPAPVQPVRGQLLQLRATGANLRRVTWGDGCYLVPWDDGSLLVGATVERVGFDEHTTVAGLNELCDGLARTLRGDWRVEVVEARAGLRPGTPDDMPIIGRSAVSPRVLYATGHYRNGVLLAPITAALVAGVLLDQRDDPLLAATRPGRFGAL